jgi:hypothetical protein
MPDHLTIKLRHRLALIKGAASLNLGAFYQHNIQHSLAEEQHTI